MTKDEAGSIKRLDALTRREQQVTALVCHGLANKEIAGKLRMAEGTVKIHLNRIFQKLGVRSRSELIVVFSEHTGST
jgi:two-component system, NarL family, nitrate/nitrite response regulator NarL